MQPRQLLIVVVAVLIAFGAAFGIAKAGGGDESKASASVKPAEVIEVGDATVSARVADAGGLPALQLPVKTPDATDDTPATTTGPEATSTPPPTTTTSPSSSSGSTTQSQATDSPITTGGGGD